ncbi:MAG TPA: TonB C-terminal domain-containing protein [Gammaproteobacteria bacterium]|nr:TonB C-terminal domain-containing protein [Gammaproteobacteria bacterium]
MEKPTVRASLAAGLGLVLTACAGSLHYWDDRKWVAEMYHAVQQGIYLPADIDPKIQYHDATVQFTYADGALQDAEVVKSSGSEIVDAAIQSQIGAIHVPVPPGPPDVEPHRFQMDVHMQMALEAYTWALHRAIFAAAHNPGGTSVGRVLLDFDYTGGKASNITVTQTSGASEIDKAAVDAVAHAKLPPTPAAFSKITHFVIGFCFGNGDYCGGSSQTVIRVSDKLEAAPGRGP